MAASRQNDAQGVSVLSADSCDGLLPLIFATNKRKDGTFVTVLESPYKRHALRANHNQALRDNKRFFAAQRINVARL